LQREGVHKSPTLPCPSFNPKDLNTREIKATTTTLGRQQLFSPLAADHHIGGRGRHLLHFIRGCGNYGVHVLRLGARVM